VPRRGQVQPRDLEAPGREELAFVDEVPGQEVNEGGMGVSLDAPGLWRFRLVDSGAGCTADFSVEVRGPTG
jgi:hypothetical protein